MYHRTIAARIIGRPIQTDEVVHHLDGNHFNNDPSNLLVCTRAWHYRIHLTKAQARRAYNARRETVLAEMQRRLGMPVEEPLPELDLAIMAPPAPSPTMISCPLCEGHQMPVIRPRLWTKKIPKISM